MEEIAVLIFEPSRIKRGNIKSRSEEHTSELQSHSDLVCRLLLEKKKKRHHKEDLISLKQAELSDIGGLWKPQCIDRGLQKLMNDRHRAGLANLRKERACIPRGVS